MAAIRKDAHSALIDALAKVESLIDAAQGDNSKCSVFNTQPGFGVEPFTTSQRDAIRRYVETWIAFPLREAVADIEGDRSYPHESALRSIVGRGY
jgi:hypothetical protein